MSLTTSVTRKSWFRSEFVLVIPVFSTRLVYLATLTMLPSLLLERGIAPELLGLLVGLYGYAAVVMDLIAGALSDRFSPGRLAAVGSTGVAGAISLLLTSVSVVPVAIARLMHGISMGLFRPSVNALVLERVAEERRAFAISINNVAYVAGAFVGPFFAGLLSDNLGIKWGMLACAVIAGVTALYLLQFTAARPKAASSVSVWANIRSLPSLVRQRRLGAPLLIVLSDITILHLWLVYLPIYLKSEYGFSLTAAGTLISVEALCYSLAQSFWGRLLDTWGYRLPVAISLLAHGAFISVLPIAGGNWWLLALLLGLCGALNAGAYPGCVAMAAGQVQSAERGRAMGLVSASSDLGQVLGPIAAGLAYQISGRYEVALALGIVLAVAGVLGAGALSADTAQ